MKEQIFKEYQKLFDEKNKQLKLFNDLTVMIDAFRQIGKKPLGAPILEREQVNSVALFSIMMDITKNTDFAERLQKFIFQENIRIQEQYQISIDNLTAKQFGA